MAYNLEDGTPSFVIEVDLLKGEKGDTGFSPRIEIASLTSAEYILKIINEDGEFYTPNLKSDLSLEDYVLKEEGKGLSTNSFENEEKQKLQELENYDDTDLRNSIANLEEKVGEEINLAQQELMDDLSKDYKGTNIIAPTVEGYGRIKKLYGKTVEEGTGEKSPDNPYTLKCVGDDVNLFDMNWFNTRVLPTTAQVITEVIPITIEAGTYRLSNKLDNGQSLNWSNTALIFRNSEKEEMLSVSPTNYFEITEEQSKKITNFYIYYNAESCIGRTIVEFKLQKGSEATQYSPYGYGTVKNISTNGTNTSSNIAYAKPLCSVGDVRDEIDYTNRKIIRRCGYKVFDGRDDEKWVLSAKYGNESYACFYTDEMLSHKAKSTYCITNIFENGCYTNKEPNKNMVSIGEILTNINLTINKTYASTVEELKTFLSTHNLIVVYELAEPYTEEIDCSDKIVQYADNTTVYNADGAEIEVSLNNSEAISDINENLKNVEENVGKTIKIINEINNVIDYSSKLVKDDTYVSKIAVHFCEVRNKTAYVALTITPKSNTMGTGNINLISGFPKIKSITGYVEIQAHVYNTTITETVRLCVHGSNLKWWYNPSMNVDTGTVIVVNAVYPVE